MYNKVSNFKWDGNTVQMVVTDEWHRFKRAKGNRTPEERHVRKLKESIQRKELFTTIIVNEDWQVIDGQHRKRAFEALNRPVMVHVVAGLVADDIKIYNFNMHNWNTDHYMEYYIELGRNDYSIYKEFRDHTKFGHVICRSLLTGLSSASNGSAKKAHEGTRNASVVFNDGEFKVTSLNHAQELAGVILDLEFKYKRTQGFVAAFQQVYDWFTDNGVTYDHERMKNAFKLYGHEITRAKGVFEFKVDIQKMYSKRRPKDVVRFIAQEEYEVNI